MTETETVELIKTKKADLEKQRSKGVSATSLKTLEDEIKKLEDTLPKKPRRTQQVFLDECAG